MKSVQTFWKVALLALTLQLAGVFPAQATITELDYWRMGENDSSDTPGTSASSTIDRIGGHTLTFPAKPAYASVSGGSTANATTGSTSCLNFSTGLYGTASLLLTSSNTPITNNFGIELWAKIGVTNGNYQCLAYNGNTGFSGWGLYVLGANWGGLFGDVTFITTTSQVQLNTWTHLALVRNNGTTTIYVNGVAVTTTTANPITPGTNFGVAAAPPSPGTTDQLENGYLDEIRVFTFAPNAFSTNDLLFNAGPPVASTSAATGITASSATLNGSVAARALDSGGYFQYGTTTNYGTTTPVTMFAANTGTSNISATVSGLASNTLYHFEATATNSAGTNFGGDLTFALPGPPVISSVTNANLTTSNGDFQVTVFPGGASTGVYFNWGLTASYGLTTSIGNVGSGTGAVTQQIPFSYAFPGVTYHFQAVATNANGTNFSGDTTVTMPGTASAINVTTTSDTSSAGSLRYALSNIASGGTITFGVSGVITLASNLPPIFKSVTLNGPGAGSLTISGANAYRIFFVDPGSGGAVNINNLTLSNGSAVGGSGGSGSGGGGGGMGAGGALFVNSGALTVSNVNFVSNSATGGAGGASPDENSGGGGGGGLGGSAGNGGANEAGGGGGGLLGNGGAPGVYGGGGGGGLLAGGGTGALYAGGGGGGLTSGGNASTSSGGAAGVDGSAGANSGNGSSLANAGNALLFGGGGGGGYGYFNVSGLGNFTGGFGGNAGAYGGGGGGSDAGGGGSGGDFGGGGGSAQNTQPGVAGGGSGGFGGGGGADYYSPGTGGFGAGGGGGGWDGSSGGAFGGYGASTGADGQDGGGGGGGALGGAIFVRTSNGATLTVYNSSMDAGTLTGGTGGTGSSDGNGNYYNGGNGSAAGGAIFTMGGTNTINVVAGTTNTIAGSIAESTPSAVAKGGAGTLVLSGVNTYSGATLVNAGTLAINGNNTSSSNLYVSSGATLAGNGTAGVVTMQSGSTIAPGISTLTTANATWNGIVTNNWQIYDATNLPGVGYGTIYVNGTLNLSNTTSVDLNLFSFSSLSPQTAGIPLDFPTLAGGAWTLIQTSGGIGGFNAAKWIINSNGFSSGLPSISFQVSVSGSNLLLTPLTVPYVSPQPVTGLNTTNATLNAQVNPYNASSTVYFLLGLTTSYGTTNSVNIGSGFSPITATNKFSSLLPGMTYHYKIVGSNSFGEAATTDQTFATPAAAPTATTGSAASITGSGATLLGSVNPGGAASGWYFQYGLTTSYGSYTLTNLLAAGDSSVAVSNAITGLAYGTTYHYSLVATNSVATGIGSDMTLTTLAAAPSLALGAVSGITESNATLNAQVTPNGTNTTVYFSWGTNSSYGSTNTAAVGSGDAAVAVSNALTGLAPDVTYHYQIVASNGVGVTSSGDQTFTTASGKAVVVTLGSTSITANSASAYGTIDPAGEATGWYFEYGTNTSYGSFTPTNLLAAGNTISGVTNTLSGLLSGALYHFQLVATNGGGTSLGGDLTLTTLASMPSMTVSAPTTIGTTSATLDASVNPNGSNTAVYFSWGLTSNYTQTDSITAGSGSTYVTSLDQLTNLSVFTVYHYEVTASNALGMTNSGDMTFFTATNFPGMTNVSWWHLGEYDPGAAPGITVTNTADSVGGFNLRANGSTAIYSSNVSPAASLAALSDLCLSLPGGIYLSEGANPSVANTNFCVEGWFYSRNTSGTQIMLYNGNAGNSGWGFGQNGGNYEIFMGGVNFQTTTVPVAVNTWIHLALICTNGISTFYTNGVAAIMFNSTPNPPGSSEFAIGAVTGGNNTFNGLIDEVRIFTFANGQFSTNMLLLNAHPMIAAFTNVVATNISPSGVTLNATVIPNAPAGGVAQAWFEYGLTTNYGSFTSTNLVPAGSALAINNVLTGLQSNSLYHFQALAWNGVGMSFSGDMTFTTEVQAPSVTVEPVSGMTGTNATVNAMVNPNESETAVLSFLGRTRPTAYRRIKLIFPWAIRRCRLLNFSQICRR